MPTDSQGHLMLPVTRDCLIANMNRLQSFACTYLGTLDDRNQVLILVVGLV